MSLKIYFVCSVIRDKFQSEIRRKPGLCYEHGYFARRQDNTQTDKQRKRILHINVSFKQCPNIIDSIRYKSEQF